MIKDDYYYKYKALKYSIKKGNKERINQNYKQNNIENTEKKLYKETDINTKPTKVAEEMNNIMKKHPDNVRSEIEKYTMNLKPVWWGQDNENNNNKFSVFNKLNPFNNKSVKQRFEKIKRDIEEDVLQSVVKRNEEVTKAIKNEIEKSIKTISKELKYKQELEPTMENIVLLLNNVWANEMLRELMVYKQNINKNIFMENKNKFEDIKLKILNLQEEEKRNEDMKKNDTEKYNNKKNDIIKELREI